MAAPNTAPDVADVAPLAQSALSTGPRKPQRVADAGAAGSRGAGYVRRTPAHAIFRRCGINLADARVLDMRRSKVETLSGFDVCTSLTALYASHNQLTDLDGVDDCRQLWRLDVSHNQVASLEGVSTFTALGYLNVEHNKLTWASLQPLARVNLIQLDIQRGNAGLQLGSLTDLQFRACVMAVLPRLWVLDGQFITEEERHRAGEWAADNLPEAVAAARDAAAARPEIWVPPGSTGEDATLLGTIMAQEPIRSDLRDSYRLRCVSQFYMRACALVNEYAATHPASKGRQSLRLPELHTRCLLPLPEQDQADICVLLSGVAEYGAPKVVLEEALSVLLAGHAPPQVVFDYARLPHFGAAILVFFLCELRKSDMDRPGGGGRGAQQSAASRHSLVSQLWSSMPPTGVICARALATELAAEVESAQPVALGDADAYMNLDLGTGSGGNATGEGGDGAQGVDELQRVSDDAERRAATALRSRHAVILLSRSPSFPSLTDAGTTQTTTERQVLEQVQGLLRAAGMTARDLRRRESKPGLTAAESTPHLMAASSWNALPWGAADQDAIMSASALVSGPSAVGWDSTADQPAGTPAAAGMANGDDGVGDAVANTGKPRTPTGLPPTDDFVPSQLPPTPTPALSVRGGMCTPLSSRSGRFGGVQLHTQHGDSSRLDGGDYGGEGDYGVLALPDYNHSLMATANTLQAAEPGLGGRPASAAGVQLAVGVHPADSTADLPSTTQPQLGIGAGGGVYRVDVGTGSSAAFSNVRLAAPGDNVLVAVRYRPEDPDDDPDDDGREGVWTTIARVLSSDVVELAPFPSIGLPPFLGRNLVRTNTLFWTPRPTAGFWRHASAMSCSQARTGLHRVHRGSTKAGMSRCESLPNSSFIPKRVVAQATLRRSQQLRTSREDGNGRDSVVPSRLGASVTGAAGQQALLSARSGMSSRRAGGDRQPAKLSSLELFTLNNTWDANFVLAPPALVEAQNDFALATGQVANADPNSGAVWTGLKHAPVSVVGNGSKLKPNGSTVPPAIGAVTMAPGERDAPLAPARSAVGDLLRGHISAHLASTMAHMQHSIDTPCVDEDGVIDGSQPSDGASNRDDDAEDNSVVGDAGSFGDGADAPWPDSAPRGEAPSLRQDDQGDDVGAGVNGSSSVGGDGGASQDVGEAVNDDAAGSKVGEAKGGETKGDDDSKGEDNEVGDGKVGDVQNGDGKLDGSQVGDDKQEDEPAGSSDGTTEVTPDTDAGGNNGGSGSTQKDAGAGGDEQQAQPATQDSGGDETTAGAEPNDDGASTSGLARSPSMAAIAGDDLTENVQESMASLVPAAGEVSPRSNPRHHLDDPSTLSGGQEPSSFFLTAVDGADVLRTHKQQAQDVVEGDDDVAEAGEPTAPQHNPRALVVGAAARSVVLPGRATTVANQAEEADVLLQALGDVPHRTGDRTWFVVSDRQQYIVSSDRVPWEGTRTHPVTQDNRVEAMRARGRDAALMGQPTASVSAAMHASLAQAQNASQIRHELRSRRAGMRSSEATRMTARAAEQANTIAARYTEQRRQLHYSGSAPEDEGEVPLEGIWPQSTRRRSRSHSLTPSLSTIDGFTPAPTPKKSTVNALAALFGAAPLQSRPPSSLRPLSNAPDVPPELLGDAFQPRHSRGPSQPASPSDDDGWDAGGFPAADPPSLPPYLIPHPRPKLVEPQHLRRDGDSRDRDDPIPSRGVSRGPGRSRRKRRLNAVPRALSASTGALPTRHRTPAGWLGVGGSRTKLHGNDGGAGDAQQPQSDAEAPAAGTTPAVARSASEAVLPSKRGRRMPGAVPLSPVSRPAAPRHPTRAPTPDCLVTNSLTPAFTQLSKSFRTRAKTPPATAPAVRPWTGHSRGAPSSPLLHQRRAHSPLRPISRGGGSPDGAQSTKSSPEPRRSRRHRGSKASHRERSRPKVDPMATRHRSRQNPSGAAAGNMSFVKLDPSVSTTVVAGWRQEATLVHDA